MRSSPRVRCDACKAWSSLLTVHSLAGTSGLPLLPQDLQGLTGTELGPRLHCRCAAWQHTVAGVGEANKSTMPVYSLHNVQVICTNSFLYKEGTSFKVPSNHGFINAVCPFWATSKTSTTCCNFPQEERVFFSNLHVHICCLPLFQKL